jgi:hypothetical protein
MLPLGALCALATAPACQVRGEVHDASEPERSTARLSVLFTRTAGSDEIRFDGQGHFVRFAASDADHVPAILGLPDDDSIPLDSCRAVDSAEALDRALEAARATLPVKLLDAGRLLVKGPLDAAALAPRHHPELTPYVGGIVYGNEDPLPLALEPGAAYEVVAEGGEDVGPFSAQASAPRAFPVVEIPAYRRGGDLELRWAEAGEASGPLVASVSWSSRAVSREVRCRVRDDGSFTVPRELLASMPSVNQLASAEVSAVRTRIAPLTAPGVARGELRVALRYVTPLPVAAWPSAGTTVPPPATPAGDER